MSCEEAELQRSPKPIYTASVLTTTRLLSVTLTWHYYLCGLVIEFSPKPVQATGCHLERGAPRHRAEIPHQAAAGLGLDGTRRSRPHAPSRCTFYHDLLTSESRQHENNTQAYPGSTDAREQKGRKRLGLASICPGGRQVVSMLGHRSSWSWVQFLRAPADSRPCNQAQESLCQCVGHSPWERHSTTPITILLEPDSQISPRLLQGAASPAGQDTGAPGGRVCGQEHSYCPTSTLRVQHIFFICITKSRKKC